jgi:pimeloyl-ACP methyl ester carboxylesterase
VNSFASHFADASGVQIHYLDEGRGSPLLLLHGGGPAASGGAHYGRNIRTLSDRFRVIVPDFPNFGASGAVASNEPNSVVNSRYADLLMGAIGVESADVVGYSMGGSAAIKFAADYPARVKRLVLLGGGTSLPTLFGPVPTEGTRAARDFARDPSRENFDRVYQLFVYDPNCLEPALLEESWRVAQDEVGRTRTAGQAPAPPRDDLFPDLPRIKAETLIVRGQDDNYGPLDQGLLALRFIPNARLHIFARCGHWIQYEKAVEFHRLLISFLEG